MRKSILLFPLVGLLAGVLSRNAFAEEAKDPIVLAQATGNPLMQLPGMNPAPSLRVPRGTMPALPQQVITDVINAPNPFDSRKPGLEGQTQISYQLMENLRVQVTLYDLFGNRVRGWDFQAGQLGGRAGTNQFLWDGTNEHGQKVSKGGYLAQIEIETPQTTVTVIRKIGVIH